MTTDTTESDGARGSAGVGTDSATDPPNRITEQFENIKQTRRRRALGWLGLFVFLAFTTLQAFAATELLNPDARLETFRESLVGFFPITDYFGVIPFLDVGRYLEFIREGGLLYDPEIGGLLFQFPPNPADIYAFFFLELGIFQIFGEAGITLAMGFVGTILGFPFALVFGTLGSERVTPFPFNFIFRGTMSFIRAVPAIIWTLIFIPFLGLGPSSAAIAIAFDTIGNLGRLFVDELEEIEDGPIEAMRTTGASKPQIVFFGMLSQVRTAFIAWTLYIFEINVRIGVTVGVIGAGGLGYVLASQQNLLRFTNMMATLLAIFLLIISVELFSQRLRSRLRSDDVEMSIWELITGFPRRMADSMLK
ncbi:phosphonate ABC transporter, permease protein PhnE [Halorubrum lipolyticum]|uniref:Phosphonate ABC transporter permease n=1 Tax=Halorubrum lipolyticum DSM 21995 TaxID=1227482 RepID=M0NV20_9EURY|nr:phosphonate ABC transporter, permease protein PhnE [Halorubrum lipolyticum]EMA61418.1 phosphonate ABC transporter permease [Halorubrum lipolyticum DSM 21995]